MPVSSLKFQYTSEHGTTVQSRLFEEYSRSESDNEYAVTHLLNPLGEKTKSGRRWVHGTLSRPNLSSNPSVICKFGRGGALPDVTQSIDSLREEFKAYKALEALQGQCIPKCYGFYVGEIIEKWPQKEDRDGKVAHTPVACLILEHCGTQMQVEKLMYAPLRPYREFVMDAVVKIHQEGYVLGKTNLKIDDVIANEKGRVFLLGLRDVSRHRGGACKVLSIEYDGDQPPISSYPCQDLWHTCENLKIWHPVSIELFGKDIPIQEAFENGEISEKKLIEKAPKNMSAEWAANMAQRAVDGYRKWKDSRIDSTV